MIEKNEYVLFVNYEHLNNQHGIKKTFGVLNDLHLIITELKYGLIYEGEPSPFIPDMKIFDFAKEMWL